MISAWVAFRPGILTPFVAQEVTLINSQTLGCLRAWIGCEDDEIEDLDVQLNVYLICSHKPLHCYLTEEFVQIGDNLLRKLLLDKVMIQSMCCLFHSHLPLFYVPRKLLHEVGSLGPVMIFGLKKFQKANKSHKNDILNDMLQDGVAKL